VAASRSYDAELELSLPDSVDDRLRVGDDQPHPDVGMLFLELAEQEWDDRASGTGRRAQLERAGDRTLVVRVEILEQMLLGGEHALSRGVEAPAGLRRLHAPAGAVEQLPPEPLLEGADLQADGWLGDPEPFGSLGEALPLDHGTECGQLTRVHKHSLCNPGPSAGSLYDQDVATPQSSDSFILRFSELTEESETRPRDAALRAFDITLSAFFLLVLLPLTVPIALLLLLTSGRPLFYRGERVGRGGHVFEMLKLRTLRENAEERLGPYLGEELVQRTRGETTAIGGWLRATQLDEIPQLWNVVRGDMSLVGPRPIRPRFFAELVEELPAYWQRLVVRPGLTGFAQVRRGYETSMAEKLAHDLEWIADRSLRLYLRTLATTAWRVLGQFARGLAARS